MQIKNFGEKYLLYELKNKNGMILKLTDIGASITGVFIKDKNNKEAVSSSGIVLDNEAASFRML